MARCQITTQNLSSSWAALKFARSQARGLRTNNYSMWLIRLSDLEGYTLQEYSDDDFREHGRPLD
jgi:hypothetical protein